MKERAISFGKTATLLGVLAEPTDRDAARTRPAVVLLNSGILHRVGACRSYVRIARRLAESGVTALRFDFSGIGDSPARRDSLAFEESSVLEVREAMDYLQRRRGFDRFVLVGLCSGADVGFETAVVDSRVVGLGQIDAYAYPTFKHQLVHYGPRMLRWSSWAGWIKRKAGIGSDAAVEEDVSEEAAMPEYVRVFPPKDVVQEKLRILADRRVEQYYVYTGGQEEYNYEKQFEDSHRAVDFRGTLQVDFLPEADHIITGLADQRRLIRSVDAWCSSCWPAADTDAATESSVPDARPVPA